MIKKIILLVIILGLGASAWFGITVASGNGAPAQTFSVAKGQGVNEISRELYDKGIIKNKFVFETWLWLEKSEGKIVAGVYDFPADMSIRRLKNILVIGPGNSQRSITLLEGWTRQMMADALDKNGLSGQSFLALTDDRNLWGNDYDWLSKLPIGASLEGFIFPDTYYVNNETTVRDFVIKTLNNFDKKFTPTLRYEIERQGRGLFDVITLASIVEREVPRAADKKMIADIFLKRLEAGIGLQSDATVNYITGKGLIQPTAADLSIDSPYNTYKYRGLPPGPIANPGIDSIEAVIYPTKNNYYYFLTTKDGEVIYSRTYDEHLANKRKYLD